MGEMIPTEKITAIRNIRTEIGDVSSLMISIKENGLLEPIGVYKDKEEYIIIYGHRRFQALKKLGRKKLEIGNEIILKDKIDLIDLIVLNTIENEEREGNRPIELAKVCNDLQVFGLNISEISARLNITKNKIKESLTLLKYVPEKYRKDISFIKISEVRNKKGKLSANVSSTITHMGLRYGLKKGDVSELFDIAKEKELSAVNIRLVSVCMSEGKSLKEAIDSLEDFRVKQVSFIVNKKEFKKIKKPLNVYLKSVLMGKEKFNKKLFMENKSEKKE